MEKGQDIRHSIEVHQTNMKGRSSNQDDFVLEKSIFSNVFEKDIRRIFIYKKAERLAKAIHLISPAFAGSLSLKGRMDDVAIGLVDAAILPPSAAKGALSRELLTLSSILSIARAGGLLSHMNAELISREAHNMLQEVAAYEEPRLTFDESPTLSDLAKKTSQNDLPRNEKVIPIKREVKRGSAASEPGNGHKGHVKDITDIRVKDRREAVLSVIRSKGLASIKDISTVIRNVSEKTIQRELTALVALGSVLKQGERRWSTYSLA